MVVRQNKKKPRSAMRKAPPKQREADDCENRMELLSEAERERTTTTVAFDCGSVTQQCRHAPKSVVSKQQVRSNWSDMFCKRRTHSILHFISCRFRQDLGFRRIILKCLDELSTKPLQDEMVQACASHLGWSYSCANTR